MVVAALEFLFSYASRMQASGTSLCIAAPKSGKV